MSVFTPEISNYSAKKKELISSGLRQQYRTSLIALQIYFQQCGLERKAERVGIFSQQRKGHASTPLKEWGSLAVGVVDASSIGIH